MNVYSVHLGGGKDDCKVAEQMIRLGFVIVAVVCVSITSVGIIFAQDAPKSGGTIRGKITDTTAAQNPIEGVEIKIVSVDGKEFIVKTDANGNYKSSVLPKGRYLINIYRKDYVERTGKPVTVVNGGDHFIPLRMRKKGYTDTQRTEDFLRHVSESVGKRYNLGASGVEAFHQSILNAIETTRKRGEDILAFREVENNGYIVWLETLLSHPDCREAFSKHLTEMQLQDYLNFTKTRRQRDQKAAVRFLTVFLDHALGLTTDQWEDITLLLLDRRNNEQQISSITVFGGQSLQHGIMNLLHDELNVSLDEILNRNQFKIWQSMVDLEKTKWNDKIAVEVLKPIKPEAHGMENGGVDVVLDGSKQQSQDESEGDVTESQLWQLAEAIFAVHTEQLGALNERATHRLALVTKGVVQQYIEAQGKTQDHDFGRFAAVSRLLEAVKDREMTREKAIEKLNTMREELCDQRDANIRSGKARVYDLIDHPLYQQTIKDVLSEEAFAQYLAHQAEKSALRQQAFRDLVIALIDLLLLLDDTQRKLLETTALQLTIPALSQEGFIITLVELVVRTDPEIFSPWQRAEWER